MMSAIQNFLIYFLLDINKYGVLFPKYLYKRHFKFWQKFKI